MHNLNVIFWKSFSFETVCYETIWEPLMKSTELFAVSSGLATVIVFSTVLSHTYPNGD